MFIFLCEMFIFFFENASFPGKFGLFKGKYLLQVVNQGKSSWIKSVLAR